MHWHDRFWSRVSVGADGECWEWLAGCDTSGYGSFRHDRVLRGAHRIAYELRIGPIPDGLTVDHLCRNKKCCNVSHMELVSRAENVRRSWRDGGHPKRRTCVNGHELAGDNLYIRPDRGYGDCLACRRERSRQHQQRSRSSGGAVNT